jgi:ribosomal protein L11 methylase PrmA
MGQELEVMEAISQAGLQLIEQYRDEKWISLVVGR